MEAGSRILYTNTFGVNRMKASRIGHSVTELVHGTDDLAAKNKRLRDVAVRMNAFRFRETDMFISREIMTARAIVHNHMGNILLLGKYYLDHPESTDESELLNTMRAANRFLVGEVETPDDITDPYDYAMKMAKSIGVTVNLQGTVPENPSARELLSQVIEQQRADAEDTDSRKRRSAKPAPHGGGYRRNYDHGVRTDIPPHPRVPRCSCRRGQQG